MKKRRVIGIIAIVVVLCGTMLTLSLIDIGGIRQLKGKSGRGEESFVAPTKEMGETYLLNVAMEMFSSVWGDKYEDFTDYTIYKIKGDDNVIVWSMPYFEMLTFYDALTPHVAINRYTGEIVTVYLKW